jgi:hypothetical protein
MVYKASGLVGFQALCMNWYSNEKDVLETGYFNPHAKGFLAPILLYP